MEPDVGEQGRETGETACTPGGEIRAVSRAESFVSHEGSGGERYLFRTPVKDSLMNILVGETCVLCNFNK